MKIANVDVLFLIVVFVVFCMGRPIIEVYTILLQARGGGGVGYLRDKAS